MDYKPVETPLYKMLLKGNRLNFPKGQVVGTFDSKPAVYLLEAGYVKRYLITKEGNHGIQVIYGPNEFLPLTPIYRAIFNMDIYRGPETYYYETMTEATIYNISLAQLIEAAENNPVLYKDLLYAAGVRLNSYIQRLENMSLRASKMEIIYQLLYLADTFGKKIPEGVKIMVPLTHQTLAEILNLARETVTRRMALLEQKNLAQTSGKHIVIPDLDRLRAEIR